jgi:hypothetical protein
MYVKASFLIGACFAFVAGNGAQAHVATISGAYDEDEYDTAELIYNNSTNYDFTNAQMVLTPYQPGTLDYSQAPEAISLGTISANTNDEVIWGNFPSAGPLSNYDFDDDWGNSAAGNPACVLPTPYCALVGNFSVAFTATWANPAYNDGAGIEISALFSPTTNATGGFVGWEGLDPNGFSESVYDDHNGSITGTLAYIDVGPPMSGVPEPATWAMSLIGFGAVGFALRGRKKAAAFTA